MDKHGQVQVVEAVLLTLITVSLWTLIWIWFYPSYMSIISEVERRLSIQERIEREWIVVEYVNFDEDSISLYITNTGDIQLDIGSIYVNGTLVWSGEEKLLVDESTTIEFEYSVIEGLYFFRICSSRGRCWEVKERAG